MTEKGEPKRDGSGGGTRANYNRGRCQDGETCDVLGNVIREQYPRRGNRNNGR